MLQKLQRDRQITVENMESGIYYLMGDAIPMQLIIVPRLSKTNNYWLNNLRNDLKSGGEIRNFIEKYGENKNSKLYQALADTIMRANWQELKEERKMCEALRELFADDLRESREEGIMEGRNVGKREGKLEGKREGDVIPILAHRGLFGMVENGWKFIWVAAIMILLPFVSSLVGIILGSIQLKKTSTKPVKIGVLLSCTGLVLHLLFRFVFKF